MAVLRLPVNGLALLVLDTSKFVRLPITTLMGCLEQEKVQVHQLVANFSKKFIIVYLPEALNLHGIFNIRCEEFFDVLK